MFPLRYGRRNSMELAHDLTQSSKTGVLADFGSVPERNSGTTQWTRNIFEGQALGLLVPVGSYITVFHLRPINPVLCWGPYPVNPVRNLILKRASRLDAFSGYHSRT